MHLSFHSAKPERDLWCNRAISHRERLVLETVCWKTVIKWAKMKGKLCQNK